MSKLKFLYVIILLALFLYGLILESTPTVIDNKNTNTNTNTAKVMKIIDGDTIKVLINNKEERIRLIGIDSPEVANERKPAQCFGKEASGKMREMLNGKTVISESDPTQSDKDEYGRLLRYVFLGNLNISELMLDEGYAREYTFKGRIYRYQSEFIQAEAKARKENKGLWRFC